MPASATTTPIRIRSARGRSRISSARATTRSTAGRSNQLTWLANDIAAVPPDRQIFVFTHFQPDRREIDLYKNLGVDAIFSGHWHGNRTPGMEGILSSNSGTARM